MRIIAGEFGSRRIVAPAGENTRPTLDQRRESLFNILQMDVPGARVLDLFAGSGAFGLEALSRGATFAVFCDNSAAACKAIKTNVESLGVEGRSELLCKDWRLALDVLKSRREAFDLIFVDPPYSIDYGPILEAVASAQIVSPEGMMIVEHDAKLPLSLPEQFGLRRTKSYRGTQVDFICPKGVEP